VANAALWEEDEKRLGASAGVFGAYLVTLLASGNAPVQQACCWAAANMLPQAGAVLMAQGLAAQLSALLVRSPAPAVRDAAASCLVRLAAVQPPPSSVVFFCSVPELRSRVFDGCCQ